MGYFLLDKCDMTWVTDIPFHQFIHHLLLHVISPALPAPPTMVRQLLANVHHMSVCPRKIYHSPYLVTHLCVLVCISVSEKCRRLKATLVRNVFSCHDFIVFQRTFCYTYPLTVIFLKSQCAGMTFTSMA